MTIETGGPEIGATVAIDAARRTVTVEARTADAGVKLAATASYDGADGETQRLLAMADRAAAAGNRSALGASLIGRHVEHMPARALFALNMLAPQLRAVARWLVASREDTNFTYDLDPRSRDHLAWTIAAATAQPVTAVRALFDEAEGDRDLADHVAQHLRASPARHLADNAARFGRRLGWYAVARLIKPRLVIETGIDKGLGAVLLCAALRRNAADGSPGRYLGTDIAAEAGYLLNGVYRTVGDIAYGDSIATLTALDRPVDLFINDSDHDPAYEAAEYRAVAPHLSAAAVIIGDNAHKTAELARFAEATGRRFLYFREEPLDHWYGGAGLGIAYPGAVTPAG